MALGAVVTAARRRRTVWALSSLFVLTGAATVSSCSLPRLAGDAGPSFDCPSSVSLVVLDELDLSGLSRSRTLLGQRLDVVGADAEHAAYCQGRFTVIAFSSSVGASAILYDGTLDPPGATQIARNREIPRFVQSVMVVLRSNLQQAMVNLPSDGSDLTAAFLLASDHVALFGRGADVRITILTDGITTAGPAQINTPGLSASQAEAAADLAPPTDLAGAHVLIEGVGTVAGPAQPPTDYVASVRAYIMELCRRSHAASCVVTTEVAVQ